MRNGASPQMINICDLSIVTPIQITLGEEILAGRKFGGNKICGIGGNLIWRMQRNVNFGGNLIGGWRKTYILAGIKFGGYAQN